jgi:hypothetical protein
MDVVSFHIKVLLNSDREELKRERNAVNVTLMKGFLHLIRSDDRDALFNILNVELPFDEWFSLDVQALHLRDLKQVFRFYPSLASEVPVKVQVKKFLLSLPLFNTAYHDLWWIFHIQDKNAQTLYCVGGGDV